MVLALKTRSDGAADRRQSTGISRRRWPERSIGLAVALVVTVLAGLWAAWAMPRGPVTPGQVVAAMLAAFVVGALSGAAVRSRWAMLAAPALFTVVFELGRAGVVGPSVDRPHLGLTVGVLVFLLGRGFAGLIMLVPMAVGAAYGAGFARRAHDREPPPAGTGRRVARAGRRVVTAAVALGLVALGVILTRPGSTPAILGPDGSPVSGSVAELATVRLGGHDQSVLIRGRSTANPVLLYLAGGPGQSDLGYTRSYMPTMENDFVFAVWDQRGTGRSYGALDPTRTWTLDQAVSDTVELTNYLRHRFGQDRIYLFGNSWGSILGTLAVQRHPELYAAYVGAGQMVSPVATDAIIYQDVLDYAARTHDDALAARMRAWGEPPYADVYAYGFLIEYYDKIGPYTRTAYFSDHAPGGLDGNGVPEYGPLDKVNKLKAIFDMGAVMYPQLQGLDFRRDVPTLNVPIYLVMGAHELRARTGPAREWFEQLAAPAKQWITFDQSGHVPQFEEFGRFHDLLTGVVVPQTRDGATG
jgi:pimeloyl-ACP methyl ester carboxylesterase